ncbi:DNA gyrase inhibitor YacG [Solimonas terrae]|uniref:DNA gyrase inhibitor YacG n=1 Tax=Solimonas terrae TaxID=1396819 RepID=UPI0015820277
MSGTAGKDNVRPHRIASCPQCGQSVRLDDANPWRPFCSERCKMLDLGEWFNGGFAIPDEEPPFGGDPGYPTPRQ